MTAGKSNRTILALITLIISFTVINSQPAGSFSIYGSSSNRDYVAGDINNSVGTNGLDVVFMVNYFKGGDQPSYICQCTPGNSWYVAGDVNNSCSFGGLDVTYLVGFLKGGPSPVPCQDCPPN